MAIILPRRLVIEGKSDALNFECPSEKVISVMVRDEGDAPKALGEGSRGPLFSIPFGLGFQSLPFWPSFMPPAIYISLGVLYFMEGRNAGYVPTVSETGTEFPNKQIMAIAFCSVAATILFGMGGMTWYVRTFYKPNLCLNFLMAFMTLAAMVGFIGLSNFPVNEDPVHHFQATFVGCGSVVGFEVVAWMATWGQTGWLLNLWRGIWVVAEVASLVTCGISGDLVDIRNNASVSALSEYLMIGLLPFFYCSYSREIADVQQHMLVEFRRTTPGNFSFAVIHGDLIGTWTLVAEAFRIV